MSQETLTLPPRSLQNRTRSKTEEGREAEDRAYEYLLNVWAPESSEDWKLLARNFRFLRGEIDQIWEVWDASGRGTLVFLEVRFRSPKKRNLSSGAGSISVQKRQHLFRAARGYLLKYRGAAQGVRFDVLSWDGWRWDFRRSAFRPTERDPIG
jgi:Holliday junction resolvase-like predicted endonuclease